MIILGIRFLITNTIHHHHHHRHESSNNTSERRHICIFVFKIDNPGHKVLEHQYNPYNRHHLTLIIDSNKRHVFFENYSQHTTYFFASLNWNFHIFGGKSSKESAVRGGINWKGISWIRRVVSLMLCKTLTVTFILPNEQYSLNIWDKTFVCAQEFCLHFCLCTKLLCTHKSLHRVLCYQPFLCSGVLCYWPFCAQEFCLHFCLCASPQGDHCPSEYPIQVGQFETNLPGIFTTEISTRDLGSGEWVFVSVSWPKTGALIILWQYSFKLSKKCCCLWILW